MTMVILMRIITKSMKWFVYAQSSLDNQNQLRNMDRCYRTDGGLEGTLKKMILLFNQHENVLKEHAGLFERKN